MGTKRFHNLFGSQTGGINWKAIVFKLPCKWQSRIFPLVLQHLLETYKREVAQRTLAAVDTEKETQR